MPAHGTPPPERFNFAHDILERNAARGDKPAYIDDAGTLSYGELDLRVRAAAAAYLALGLRREERVLLCLQDTVDFPGGVPGRALRGHRAGRGQHAADGGRLRIHAGAQPRAGAAGVRRVAADAAAGAGARRARREARHRFARGVAPPCPEPRSILRAWSERAGADGAARGHGRRRHGVLALFVRLDRTAEGNGAHACQPALDGGALRQRPSWA